MGSPLDDSSVSALTALDNAVEAVAAAGRAGGGQRAGHFEGLRRGSLAQRRRPGWAGAGAASRLRAVLRPNGPLAGPASRAGTPLPGNSSRSASSMASTGVAALIVSPDGYIVTNNHVVDGAVQVKVTLNDRRVMDAKVIGTDKLTDLAVIKIEGHNLPYIGWGDSSALRPGQTVLAFGSPFGWRSRIR